MLAASARRGYSTLVMAAIIALVLFPLIALFLTLVQSTIAAAGSSYALLSRYMELYSQERIAVTYSGAIVNITNIGIRPLRIAYIVVSNGSAATVYRANAIAPSCINLDPLQSCLLVLNTTETLIAVITEDGVVIRPEVVNVPIAVVSTPEIYTITLLNATSPQGLANIFNVPQNLVSLPFSRYVKSQKHSGYATGVAGRSLYYLVKRYSVKLNGTTAQIYAENVPFGVAVIGYDPSWLRERSSSAPRFRILLTGFLRLRGPIGLRKLYIDEWNKFERIKIYNFSGTIEILKIDPENGKARVIACAPYPTCAGGNQTIRNALGFWYYGYDLNLAITLDGVATSLREYRTWSPGNVGSRTTSYDPYLFIADIDGNNVTDMVLITEDAAYGSVDSIDDYIYGYDLSTYSVEPLNLTLNLSTLTGISNGSIPGSKYAGAYLYLNIFFHDNSYPDTEQLDDNPDTRVVLRILLVSSNGTAYTVREYAYQEIANYHQTLITDFSRGNTYFTKLTQVIYIPIPKEGSYWIVIQLQDPYYEEDPYNPSSLCSPGASCVNDADFTVGIEIIGVLLLSR